jgi:short-subunit dehydrogenase
VKINSDKIINVSSIGSEMGLPFRGFYSASKSALDKVTEAMRYEVYPWNVCRMFAAFGRY